jgi:uncharacterized membrane protein
MQSTQLFLAILITLLIIDFIWLTIAKPIYIPHLTHVQFGNPIKFNFIHASISYLIMATVITFLLIPRIKNDSSTHNILITGTLGALAMYGVYNFTNAATLQNWTLTPLLIDLTWGLFITTTTLFIAHKYFI